MRDPQALEQVRPLAPARERHVAGHGQMREEPVVLGQISHAAPLGVHVDAACGVIEHAQALLEQGAFKVIVGTSAFNSKGPNHEFLQSLVDAIGRDRIVIALDSKSGLDVSSSKAGANR